MGNLSLKSANQPKNYLYLIGFLLFTIIYLKNAWVAEDAYILFRSIEQLFAGNGPVWNPHERVQVFTSPLWYLLLSFARIFSRDLYLNAVVVSFFICSAMLLVLRLLIKDSLKWLCIVFLLACSKGFFDFTSSGIENPLASLLLVTFFFYYNRLKHTLDEKGASSTDFSLLALCFGLLLTCRHDLITLALPPLLLVCWEQRLMKSYKMPLLLVAGLLPFLAWSLFSTFYYGFPFPNTAYAKLNTGIPRGELWAQGLNYLTSSLQHDPVTLSGIAAAVVVLLCMRNRYAIAVACGIVLNLLYVVTVGGDFMQGRFLSSAYLVSLCAAFCYFRVSGKAVTAILLACCVYWFSYPDNPVSTPLTYSKNVAQTIDSHGVADERGFYFSSSSLWSYLHREANRPFPAHQWSVKGWNFSRSNAPATLFSNIGFFGYWAGVHKVIVDDAALADPFLSRLPSLTPWRIGHFDRKLPEGYLESVISGQNVLKDPQLRELYGNIRLITQGPLWQKERLRAIYLSNFGL
jgi:arabinofuranosyltransferase